MITEPPGLEALSESERHQFKPLLDFATQKDLPIEIWQNSAKPLIRVMLPTVRRLIRYQDGRVGLLPVYRLGKTLPEALQSLAEAIQGAILLQADPSNGRTIIVPKEWNQEEPLEERVAEPSHIRPATPGEVLADLMESNNLTDGALAERLKVGRLTVQHLRTDRRRLTPSMAGRLGRCFGNGPAVWMRVQYAVDLWDLQSNPSEFPSIRPLSEDAQ